MITLDCKAHDDRRIRSLQVNRNSIRCLMQHMNGSYELFLIGFV